MCSFEDFDLDLKKVSSKGVDGSTTTTIEITTKISKLSKAICNEPSVTPPTTGMTVGCCKKENEAEPRCV